MSKPKILGLVIPKTLTKQKEIELSLLVKTFSNAGWILRTNCMTGGNKYVGNSIPDVRKILYLPDTTWAEDWKIESESVAYPPPVEVIEWAEEELKKHKLPITDTNLSLVFVVYGYKSVVPSTIILCTDKGFLNRYKDLFTQKVFCTEEKYQTGLKEYLKNEC
jgi:hypothetical protein